MNVQDVNQIEQVNIQFNHRSTGAQKVQKQPPRGVPRKRCSENMLQSNFIDIALRHGCPPVNLLHISIIYFLKNTSGWLLLKVRKKSIQHLLSFLTFKFPTLSYSVFFDKNQIDFTSCYFIMSKKRHFWGIFQLHFSSVTGSNSWQSIFKTFVLINWGELRKNQYSYDHNFFAQHKSYHSEKIKLFYKPCL